MMKSVLTLLFCFMLLSVTGNDAIRGTLYLTNYTIQSASDVIGKVMGRGGSISSVKVVGKDAGLFSIGKDHTLHVKKGKLPVGQSRFEIIINATSLTGQVSESFVIVKDEFIRNRVVAHRGAWKNTGAPENSIAAFRHAAQLGCEGSEFDVHMSADSIPMVNHDNSIQGVSIAKTQSPELLKIKLPNGEPIPTLEAYLRAGMEQSKTKLVLEIKSSELGKASSIALTGKVVEMVERLQAQAWVDYIAFDFDVCKEVMRLAPYARVAYLNGDKTPDELATDHFFGLDYNIKVIQKNTDWISNAHARKLTVNVWTVNDVDVMKELLDQNVEFITTNEPEALLNIVRQPSAK
jgi:glycerophosphoryl diester phosphodiesterase